MPTLSPSAYVVLGLLDRYGPKTPYALDRSIRASLGYFWGFPRSQLYAEAERLVRRGMVAEEREDAGRRRRSLSITDDGRAEFTRWLAGGPVAEPTEIRDEGLLRLFFQPDGAADDTQTHRLAVEQSAEHRRKLAEYTAILGTNHVAPGSPSAATLALGLRFERLAIAFWDEIADGGTRAVDPAR